MSATDIKGVYEKVLKNVNKLDLTDEMILKFCCCLVMSADFKLALDEMSDKTLKPMEQIAALMQLRADKRYKKFMQAVQKDVRSVFNIQGQLGKNELLSILKTRVQDTSLTVRDLQALSEQIAKLEGYYNQQGIDDFVVNVNWTSSEDLGSLTVIELDLKDED